MSDSESSGTSRQIDPPPPDEDSLTMVDVLEEQQELDKDVEAVLGSSDDKVCSYSLGYVKRQPLYSCVTCNDPNNPAGICLACSYHCHEGHELIELYTKRNFRCDCGSATQPDSSCRLLEKSGTNNKNRYNQNFRGLYCSCHKPYPDPEDDTLDDMIQCIICEDWFHGKHLEVKTFKDIVFSEMTCMDCVRKLPFLSGYYNEKLAVFEPTMVTDKVRPSPKKSPKKSSDSCIKNLPVVPVTHNIFWREGWRKHLCKCVQCLHMYTVHKVEFLMDEEDTVSFYEASSTSSSNSYDRGMEALSSMDRIQQVEVVSEYNHLKSELVDYLRKFAENKKVVREEDIKEFFSDLRARKRPRFDIPDNCR